MLTALFKEASRLKSGENVTLTCRVMSGAASTGFQWLRDAALLPAGAGASDEFLPLPSQPSNANETRLARRYYRIEVSSLSFACSTALDSYAHCRTRESRRASCCST